MDLKLGENKLPGCTSDGRCTVPQDTINSVLMPEFWHVHKN